MRNQQLKQIKDRVILFQRSPRLCKVTKLNLDYNVCPFCDRVVRVVDVCFMKHTIFTNVSKTCEGSEALCVEHRR